MALYRKHEAEIERAQSGGAVTGGGALAGGGGTTDDGIEEEWVEEYETDFETEVEAEPGTDREAERTVTTWDAAATSATPVNSVAAAFWQSGLAAIKAAPPTRAATTALEPRENRVRQDSGLTLDTGVPGPHIK